MKKIKQLIILSVFTLTTIYLFSLTLLIQRIYFDNKKPSEYILVLGARSYKKQGQYNPCLYGRVLHAVDLYKQGYSKKLIFTGGTDKEDGQNEAETMKKIAIELGIPENNIYLEKESASTFENIEYSKKIIGSYSQLLLQRFFIHHGLVWWRQNKI